jgi:hypothetical protein
MLADEAVLRHDTVHGEYAVLVPLFAVGTFELVVAVRMEGGKFEEVVSEDIVIEDGEACTLFAFDAGPRKRCTLSNYQDL